MPGISAWSREQERPQTSDSWSTATHDAAFDWLQVANDAHDTYGARVYLELGRRLAHAHAAHQGQKNESRY